MPNVSLFGAFAMPGGSENSTVKLRTLVADYRFDAESIVVEQDAPDGQSKVTHMLPFGISPHDRLAVADGLETNPPLRREVTRKVAWLASIVVLLMAMTLVSLVDFMMAEHVARQHEQAVRSALGATPLDVFRQTLAKTQSGSWSWRWWPSLRSVTWPKCCSA